MNRSRRIPHLVTDTEAVEVGRTGTNGGNWANKRFQMGQL